MKENLALLEDKEIRKTYIDGKWFFSIVDVIDVLTNSNDPKQYLKKLKVRDIELQNNWGTICTLLKMKASDGKFKNRC